jgi:hypothetical protein
MIHTDGKPTVASRGVPCARLASVFGLKPLIVEDAMQREVGQQEASEDFRAMNYGAWRAYANLRSTIEESEVPLDASEILVLLAVLETTYEGLYRASV